MACIIRAYEVPFAEPLLEGAAENGETSEHERICLHIWEDKRAGGDLYTHLRRQGKKYQKHCNGKTSRGRLKKRVGIEHRPSIVEEKTRV